MRFRFATKSDEEIDIEAVANLLKRYAEQYNLKFDTLNIYATFKKGDFKYELYSKSKDGNVSEVWMDYKDIRLDKDVPDSLVALRSKEYKETLAAQRMKEVMEEEKKKQAHLRQINTGIIVIGKKENGTYKFYYLGHTPSEKKKEGYLGRLSKMKHKIEVYKVFKSQSVNVVEAKIKDVFKAEKYKDKNGSYNLNEEDLLLAEKIIINT